MSSRAEYLLKSTAAPTPPASEPSGSPIQDRVWWVTCFVLLGAIVGALFMVPYLPTHDGPQHIYGAWAENHWDELTFLHDRLQLNPNRVTALGFGAVFRPLERVMPWRGAYMSSLGILALATGLGIFAAAQVASRRLELRSFAWFAVPLTMPWMLYMGYLNYLSGLALTGWALLLTIVSLRRHESGGLRASILPLLLLTGLMLAQSVAHAFAACLTGVMVFAMATATAVERRSAALFGAFALPAAPVLAIAALTSRTGSIAAAVPAEMDAGFRIKLAFSTLTGGLVPLTAGLLVLGVVVAVAAIARPSYSWSRGLGLAALALIGTHILAPFDIPGWFVFAPRFGVPGVVAALIAGCGMRPLEHPLASRALPVFGAGLALVWALSTGMMHRMVYEDCSEALEPLILTEERNIGFFPMHICGGADIHPMPVVHWLRNADAIFAMDNRGLPDVFYGAEAIHPFLGGDSPPAPPISDWASLDTLKLTEAGDPFGVPADQPPEWLHLSAYIASAMAERDIAVLYGEVAVPLRVIERGFFVSTEPGRPRTFITQFVGCRVRVEVAGAADELSARGRFYPNETWHPLNSRQQSDGRWLVNVPCGAAALEFWEDTNGDAAPDDSERRCADAEGATELLRLIPLGDEPTIPCSMD